MKRVPRLGFVGLGWIGTLRLEAVRSSGEARIVALCDAERARLEELGADHPDARRYADFEALVDASDELELDGVVIATPTGLHAPQALRALSRGLAVFVQKPLGVEPGEVEAVLGTAEATNVPMEVDFSYRGLECARRAREAVAQGELGSVFHVEARFHNAYGPDKDWCYDPLLAGGGALLDLGVHMLDLALWCLDRRGFGTGRGWTRNLSEDPRIDGFSVLDVEIEEGPPLHLATSWHANAGRDCDFSLVLHGSQASMEIRDVGGSFYDFELVVREGTSERRVAEDHRTWMDRPILEWVRRVAAGEGFDPQVRSSLALARLLDQIYPEPEGGPDDQAPPPVASAISSNAR